MNNGNCVLYAEVEGLILSLPYLLPFLTELLTLAIGAKAKEPFYHLELCNVWIVERSKRLVHCICVLEMNPLIPYENTVVLPIGLDCRDPIIYADGIHDDTEALQAAIDGKVVRFPNGRIWNYVVSDSGERKDDE